MIDLTKNAKYFIEAFDAAVEKFCVTGVDFNIVKLMSQFNLKSKDIPLIQEYVESDARELLEAIAKTDEQLVEAYAFLGKVRLRGLSEKYQTILSFGAVRKHIKQIVKGVSFKAVFAICKKYNVIRCFIGNVQIDGSKVSASDSYVMTFKSKFKVENAIGKSFEEIMDFVKQGKKSPRPVNTISGNTVDAVMKF